jgi:glycosyltransferase involved in cell wall biosynthesis
MGGQVAFLGNLGVGGPYRTFTAFRNGLRAYGFTVRWLSLGPDAQALIDAPEWAHERAFGSVLAPDTRDERQQAVALLDHLETEGYVAVIVNVLGDRVQSSIVRHLDRQIRRIMIVHSITPGTYAAARSIQNYVHAIVGVSPRIREDLVRQGIPPMHTHVIANAFDSSDFSQQERKPWDGPLRILSLGRLEDASKGIFWLPGILRELRDLPLTFTIAGDGPDGEKLRHLFADQLDRTRFLGMVPLDEVAGVMAEHDVFLLPSRYEGQSIALVEALATGCVPVASHIRGVTDFVVEPNETGFLFPVGDVKLAARLVRKLESDRHLLARMSIAARLSAAKRFQPESMAAAYVEVLEGVMSYPRAISLPLPHSEWCLPAGLRPGLRSLLPTGVKNRVRGVMERLAL